MGEASGVNIRGYGTLLLYNKYYDEMLTQRQDTDHSGQYVFSFRRHGHPQAERPDRVLGEREHDDGHHGRTDVHDRHERVDETGQRAPERVQVSERLLVVAELTSGLADQCAQLGVGQSSCGTRGSHHEKQNRTNPHPPSAHTPTTASHDPEQESAVPMTVYSGHALRSE